MKRIILILSTLILASSLFAQESTLKKNFIIYKPTPTLILNSPTGGIDATINFNSGDILLRQTANTLTLSGGNLSLGANSLLFTGSLGTTGARLTKGWFTNLEITNLPTINGTSIFASPTMTGTLTVPAISVTGANTVTLSGDATTWNDIFFPFDVGHQGNADYPPLVKDSLYYAFTVDSAGADAVYEAFIIQLPHNYKTGSVIFPHVHYKQEGANTPVFKVRYKWYNYGGSTQKGWKWYTMSTSTGTTDKTHQLVHGANGITATGITGISSIMICQVYLSALAGGTTACNAYQFDIHIEIDSFGSRTETSK